MMEWHASSKAPAHIGACASRMRNVPPSDPCQQRSMDTPPSFTHVSAMDHPFSWLKTVCSTNQCMSLCRSLGTGMTFRKCTGSSSLASALLYSLNESLHGIPTLFRNTFGTMSSWPAIIIRIVPDPPRSRVSMMSHGSSTSISAPRPLWRNSALAEQVLPNSSTSSTETLEPNSAHKDNARSKRFFGASGIS